MPGDECCVDLDLGELPEEVVEYARVNLGESPETRLKSIQDLRDMIYERGECTPHRMDDAFLLRFLRARYFIVERAHRLFVNYCTFKEDNPDIQNNVEPMALRFIGDANVLSVPPYRDQDGRRWMMYRIGNWDPTAYSVEELFKATLVVLELGILEQRAQVLGGVCLFDFENLSMQHAWQVTPSVASKVVQLMVTCFPIKTHALHIINQSWVFDTIYSMFKPLLDDRMRQKIFFHGNNMESLHKHVSPKYLPERYGGTRPDVSYTLWLDSLKSKPNIVKEMVTLGYKFDPKDIPSETKPDEPKKITNETPVDAIKEMDKSIVIKE